MSHLKTRQKGTRTTILVANLTREDRCDQGGCGAAAGSVIVLPSTLELLFCNHHLNKNREQLVVQGAVFYAKED